MTERKTLASRRRKRRRPRIREFCPVRATIAVLEQKWTMAIVMALLKDTRRFTELAEVTPGLNTRTLTERLRNLEALGIVSRQEGDGLTVLYSLTDKGQDLKGVLRSIARWGKRWMELPRERETVRIQDPLPMPGRGLRPGP